MAEVLEAAVGARPHPLESHSSYHGPHVAVRRLHYVNDGIARDAGGVVRVVQVVREGARRAVHPVEAAVPGRHPEVAVAASVTDLHPLSEIEVVSNGVAA